MKPLTKTQKLIIRRITVTFQREWLTNYKRIGKEIEPVKVISKKVQPIYKGKLGVEHNKITTAKDLENIGLLNPIRKTISLITSNDTILYQLGFRPKLKRKKFVLRPSNKLKKEVVWIWSEELYSFIKPVPVHIKKEKKLSPYWTNKLIEYETKRKNTNLS